MAMDAVSSIGVDYSNIVIGRMMDSDLFCITDPFNLIRYD